MSVGQASGLALAEAEEAGCEVVQYTANEVKQAVAGYGAAPKEQVQRMVRTLLALDDVWPVLCDQRTQRPLDRHEPCR